MGNKYSGNYKEDQRHGWGVMEWIDGSTYKGQWERGIQQGFGIMTYNTDVQAGATEAPGKVRAGFFENNVFSKPLVRLEELKDKAGLTEEDLEEDIVEEVRIYLRNREKKA